MNVHEKRQRYLINIHERNRRNSRNRIFDSTHNHEAGWWWQQPVALLCLCLALVTVVSRRLVYYEKNMRCERRSASRVIEQALM